MINNLYRFTYALKHTYKTLICDVRRRTSHPLNFERNYSSALYVSGNKAYKSFAYLSPYLDFDERFANVDKLQKNLALRGMDVDIVLLKEAWDFYTKVVADRYALENNNKKLTDRMKTLLENVEHTAEQEQEMLKLRTQLKIIRQDLKMMKEAMWDLDEDVIEKVLKLPNELDPRTPVGEPVILKSVGNLPEISEKKRSHLDVGTSLDLLEYKNSMCYFLSNDAALFELAILAHVGRVLGENNMIKVAGTDFSRSFVVEASGLNHEDPMASFVIENHNEVERGSPNRMHLVGGASLVSFLALHTKQLINPKNFPLKYFATGRQYIPSPRDSHTYGLFTICQASVAHSFIMVKDAKSEEYKILFEELLEIVCRLYDDLCNHYRVVMRPASELQSCEEMRVSFEMWSPFLNRYIEIGHVSTYGDYFSKRLLIVYQTSTGREFPSMISGTILSVPRLLACLLEQNPDRFVIPSKIAEFIPSDNYIM
ncbi:PREDICTED: serine--tRNA synthetase-like protein Slimp [Trachymyrmex cornetzi]|uniref:serine--tRNA synthetase-like protein Slimp n=1 Tax=Trachymyrmex cornetzi TaxID=471704 RepID=UPI00084EFF06|nr:PREDICTED: serine--tRNA synthetase-like protein Slimp [Trachymyrmex cornetzi]